MMHDLDLIDTLTVGLAAALALGYLNNRIGRSPIIGYLLARRRRSTFPRWSRRRCRRRNPAAAQADRCSTPGRWPSGLTSNPRMELGSPSHERVSHDVLVTSLLPRRRLISQCSGPCEYPRPHLDMGQPKFRAFSSFGMQPFEDFGIAPRARRPPKPVVDEFMTNNQRRGHVKRLDARQLT